MKNKLFKAIATLVFTFSTTYLFAGNFAVGILGSVSTVEADGTESTFQAGAASDKNTGTARNANTILGSVYAEYEASNGFAFGIEYMPGSADVSDKVKKRVETPLSITGNAGVQSTSVTRQAQAEIEDYTVLYAEAPVFAEGMFIRIGVAQLDVNTTENLASNSGSYGNATLDGINFGAGIKGNMSWNDNVAYKFYLEKTTFDTLSLTSTGNSVATETNTITADLDVASVKFGLGYKF